MYRALRYRMAIFKKQEQIFFFGERRRQSRVVLRVTGDVQALIDVTRSKYATRTGCIARDEVEVYFFLAR